jgi:hypothetical protein
VRARVGRDESVSGRVCVSESECVCVRALNSQRQKLFTFASAVGGWLKAISLEMHMEMARHGKTERTWKGDGDGCGEGGCGRRGWLSEE